jgi:carbamoyltransferase
MDGPLVLGVAAAQHNGAACLMRGDTILAAIQEERVTRLKRQGIGGGRPAASIAYCLDAAGVEIDDLDLVVLCTQTSRTAPEHDVLSNPQLEDIVRRGKLRFLPHHRGHALSVLAWAGFDEAAILVADGIGSPWQDLPAEEKAFAPPLSAGLSETLSLYHASGWRLEPVGKQFAPTEAWLVISPEGLPQYQSLGGMYSAFAYRIFGDALEAGKVMGLASHAAPAIGVEHFVTLSESGFVFPNNLPPHFHTMPSGCPADDTAKVAAASVQFALEEALLHIARQLRQATKSTNLGFAGGVALNAIANERLLREAGFQRVQVIPAAEDSGTALGAAVHGLLELGYPVAKQRRLSDALGRAYREDEILAAASRFSGLRGRPQADIALRIAEKLAAGRICGWFQGGSEFGPRALGHRSILADPRDSSVKTKLDYSIKRRESFRPYAPVVLLSDAEAWFATGPEPESPFMLRVVEVREHIRESIPAVVHVDGSARLQTVDPRDGIFFRLLQHFKALTGVPVLLNTSFNDRAEPIVETPFDALRHFISCDLDICAIGDWLFEK